MSKFTIIPTNAFDALQMDAGVLLKKFDPENPVRPADEDIICATSGGVNPSCVATFSDFGEDVDNVPPNMMELKHLDGWEVKLATTCLGTSPELIKLSLGAADIPGTNKCQIIPRRDLRLTDFSSIWWVGDKSNGGFVAIQIVNALSTGGFSLQSGKNAKGTVALEITGHVSINDQDTVPMVIYSYDANFRDVTLKAVGETFEVNDVLVGDLQSGVYIDGAAIKGTLKWYKDADGKLSGNGNYIALSVSDLDDSATSVKIGLVAADDADPTANMVEMYSDPVRRAIFKVEDKDKQDVQIIITDGTDSKTQTYDLSGLTLENPFADVAIAPLEDSLTVFGAAISDLQSGITVQDDAISGTLNYFDDVNSDLVQKWGAGYFIALKFSGIDADVTSVKAGLDPSQSSGLVELINDPDKSGIWKVTDKDSQTFKIVSSDSEDSYTQTFTLTGLTLETVSTGA